MPIMVGKKQFTAYVVLTVMVICATTCNHVSMAASVGNKIANAGGHGDDNSLGGKMNTNPLFRQSNNNQPDQDDAKKDNGNNNNDPFPDLSKINVTQIRIDRIKARILRKIRLTEPPKVGDNLRDRAVPKQILNLDYEFEETQPDPKNLDETDFYGKTTQLFVFGEHVTKHCRKHACFDFIFSHDLMEKTIDSAELWFYPLTNKSELLKIYRNGVNGKTFISSRYSNISRFNDGWINIDVTTLVKSWLSGHEGLLNSIKITCKTCKNKLVKFIGNSGAMRPFLTINTVKPKAKKSGTMDMFRSLSFKNSPINACRKQSTHCCVEEFYVNFEEIGWSDWIISPKGYNANYCRGTCFGMDSDGYRLNILQKLSEKDSSLIPCCSPGKMSSLTIIYLDGNGYLHKLLLPNMRVEQCQCF